ncbi:hypothetical protein [Modicisalibacter ilicicola]|uniref:hypothetical protein n=1 Tax=Modicisalibacter ilicicola TaxID=480814 RepID=UPI001FE9EE1A|nr:hypothetical protein [Halomonas ilicicola]
MIALVACADDKPADVSLSVLATRQAAYSGKQVDTRGVVRTFETPRHYWIEDDDLNRVEVLPAERIAPYLGERVRVGGRFHYAPSEGRRLEVERIEVIDGTR